MLPELITLRRYLNQFSLYTILIVPIILHLVVTVGLVIYLSSRNSEQAIYSLSSQIHKQVSARVEQYLSSYLEKPQLINRLNLDAINNAQLDLTNLLELERHFKSQLLQFQTVDSIYYGGLNGEFVGVNVKDEWIMHTEVTQPNQLYKSNLVAEQFEKIANDYDVKEEIWYKQAMQNLKAQWSPIAQYNASDSFILSFNQAITINPCVPKKCEKVQGVFSTQLNLSALSHFLAQLNVEETSSIFIIEPNGLLVATSSQEIPYTVGRKIKRLSAIESSNLLIKEAINQLQQKNVDLTQIKTALQFNYKAGNQRYLIQFTPYRSAGLEWLIGVVVPEIGLMGQIYKNTQYTLLLSLLALIIAIALGVRLVSWIVRPISVLETTTRRIAQGRFDILPNFSRQDELGRLSRSINEMALQLRSSFEQLQNKNEELMQLRELDALKFHDMAENVPEVLFQIYCLRDGTLGFNYLSARCYDYFGYLPDELIRDWQKFPLPEEKRPEFEQSLRQSATHLIENLDKYKVDEWQYEGQLFDIKLKLRWYRCVARLNLNSQDDVFFNGILVDMTDSHSIQENLKFAKEQAELAQKAAENANQAKSSFLATMSHELRTPLNGILGYAQILSNDSQLNEKQLEEVKIIQRSGHHLLTLINDVLDLAKIEAGKLDIVANEFNLQDFFKEVVDLFKINTRQKNLEFSFQVLNESKMARLSDLPMMVQMDEKRLRQIFFNLLSNAIKFTQRGKVGLILERQNMNLRCKIQDTGVGIAESDLERIFIAFQQVGNKAYQTEGTGLGLAITQRLVRKLGGELKVISQLGEGSCFHFEIPLNIILDKKVGQSSITTTIEHRQKIVGYEGEPRRILIVDDSLENRILLHNWLSHIGFILLEADNGETTINLLEECYQTRTVPDIILMDMKMPVMDGVTCTKHLRMDSRFINLPIIAVSASTFIAEQKSYLAAGCNYFLGKPVQFRELFEVLEKYCHLQWKYAKELKVENYPAEVSLPNIELLPLPSLEHLWELLHIVEAGNLRFFLQRSEQLLKEYSQSDNEFLQALLLLAKNFEMRKLKTSLKEAIEKSAVDTEFS